MRILKTKVARFLNAKYHRYPNIMHPWFYPAKDNTGRLPADCSLSDTFLQRLCDAYILAKPSVNTDIWSNLKSHSAAFCNALASSDLNLLRSVLADCFGTTSPLVGMAHTASALKPKSSLRRHYFTLRSRDALLSLAEALAIRPVMSNVQTSMKDYLNTINGDMSGLLAAVERRLGHSLAPPRLGGAPVAFVGSVLLNPDSLRHAYVPERIAQLEINPHAPILEIGGGFGIVAKYAYMRGHRNYTIIDLPFACAVQAAFLADALGETVVRLFGEAEGPPLTLWPSTMRTSLASRYNLVLNMDSLPEIEEAPSYIDFIVERADLFLSINQESENNRSGFTQHFLARLCDERPKMSRRSRHPYWMEQGYSEELYAIERN